MRVNGDRERGTATRDRARGMETGNVSQWRQRNGRSNKS
jgi:hypothetical protein